MSAHGPSYAQKTTSNTRYRMQKIHRENTQGASQICTPALSCETHACAEPRSRCKKVHYQAVMRRWAHRFSTHPSKPKGKSARHRHHYHMRRTYGSVRLKVAVMTRFR